MSQCRPSRSTRRDGWKEVGQLPFVFADGDQMGIVIFVSPEEG